MATCRRCGVESDAEALVRHERGGLVVVHCPDCGGTMGIWRDPSVRAVRDRRE